MKIATWNVNSGPIHERMDELRSQFDVDVVAMQETAEPHDGLADCLWSGDLKHKGVSLSCNAGFERVEVAGETSPCIAAQVMDSAMGPFNVLALWAKPTPTYFADLTRTLDLYESFIRHRETVILGDFNMTLRVQSKGKQFYLLNARLNHDFDVHSAYHEYTNERFGMETMTTLYHQWGASGCFHCDFVYIPASWICRLRGVTIPGYSSFSTSDHRPVVCEFT